MWDKITKGVFIIAEAGKNFIQTEEERPVEEYLANAKLLVDEAKAAGADAIKFQTHNVEDEQLNMGNVVSPHFQGVDRYQWVSRNTASTPVDGFWKPLKEYCDAKGIIFFSTPMSRGAAIILDNVGVNLWKVGSGDILDFALLDYLRNTRKPIIISSGMSTLEEVEKAVAFLKEKNNKIVLMHCVSKYPCPPEELRLRTIEFFKEKFDIPIGFSDHSLEVEPAVLAVALGATILEKHFSISRKLWGADHKVSLVPEEFKSLVKSIRNTERCLGDKAKILQSGEAIFRPLFRKSLVAAEDILPGAIVNASMLYTMRPQENIGGLASEKYNFVLGKKVKKALKKYEPLTEDILSD